MITKLNLYKFTKGAKRDLLALHNKYKLSAIINIVKRARANKNHSPKIVEDSIVIHVVDKLIIGVSVTYLKGYAREHLFRCDICLDSHKIQVGDDCGFCGGSGCGDCRGGLLFNTIACPQCTSKNIIRSEINERSDRTIHKQQERYGNRRSIPSKAKRHSRGKVSRRN